MLPRIIKKSFFSLLGPMMRINGFLYRIFRAPCHGVVKVQLGPGQGNYLPGWINVDANIVTAKCDVWADLRNNLPFRNNTIDTFYSHHVIEHLPDLQAHFRDVFRCLKPGGVYRAGGPNGDSAIKKFMKNEKEWFLNFPDNRGSIGGRFENEIFCRGEHLTILTFSFLEELLMGCGFENIREVKPVLETGYPDRFAECLKMEWESDFETPHTLVVEAKKPVGQCKCV